MVARFSKYRDCSVFSFIFREVIGPHVEKMDEEGRIHPDILPQCFENGDFTTFRVFADSRQD